MGVGAQAHTRDTDGHDQKTWSLADDEAAGTPVPETSPPLPGASTAPRPRLAKATMPRGGAMIRVGVGTTSIEVR